MSHPDDIVYWIWFWFFTALFVAIPLGFIFALTGFFHRMIPVMASIITLFIHGHRRPE